MTPEAQKAAAALEACKLVTAGMKVGLGTGSTAGHLVEALGRRRREEGLDILCVPTSEATRALAEHVGLRLTTLDETPFLDLTIDGADEIDAHLRLIKGGGGALLREKIVAAASERMVVIADASKRVAVLGAFPLPVEVVRFGLASTHAMIGALADEAGCSGEIRLRKGKDGAPFVTDNGNYILDCDFGRIDEPEILSDVLLAVPGVVEHGLFIGFADAALIGGPNGVERIEAAPVPA